MTEIQAGSESYMQIRSDMHAHAHSGISHIKQKQPMPAGAAGRGNRGGDSVNISALANIMAKAEHNIDTEVFRADKVTAFKAWASDDQALISDSQILSIMSRLV